MTLRRAVAPLVALLALIVVPSPAHGVPRPFAIGFADPLYHSGDDASRRAAFDGAAAVDAGYVRIGAGWRGLAAQRPATPTDPDDPAYRFGGLDRALSEAAERGLIPIVTVQSAPSWAEGANRPASAHVGSWKPDPRALGELAFALATRYSGSYPDPADPSRTFPRVRFFEVWNEVNLPTYLAPQWVDGRSYAPQHYRRMVSAFTRAAHEAQPGVRVLAGAFSPIGDGSPSFIDGEPVQPNQWGRRSHPMRFLREMLCLRGGERLQPKPCQGRARFDILSAHPISQAAGPREHAMHPNDIAIADLPEVKRTLRAAEQHGLVAGKGRHPVWVTEYWWQTRPPREQEAYGTLEQQARWIAEGQMALWELKVPVGIMYSVRDERLRRDKPSFQAGLYFEDGTPKPSLAAAQFPLAAKRRSRDAVDVWTRPPVSGTVSLQRLVDGQWQTVRRLAASAGVPLSRTIKMRQAGSLRATISGRMSYVYALRG